MLQRKARKKYQHLEEEKHKKREYAHNYLLHRKSTY